MDKKKAGRRNLRTMVKAAAIAGAVIIAGSTACYTNPAFAEKIPILGSIFEQVEDNVLYSGKYSKEVHIKNLQTEETTLDGKIYSATSSGTTITASEIYSDGYSVYLTVKIESENGGFNSTTSHFTTRFGEKNAQSL